MFERFDDRATFSNRAAIIFVHGFNGDRRGTWGRIPDFLQAEGSLSDWDLLGFGYQSKRRFDLLKLWSADARLEEIATMLFSAPELNKYAALAFVAHSMGGLVVQRALVKYSELRARTSHVIMLGTPSTGLVKATVLSLLKQQIRNMSATGEFIRDLRASWANLNLDIAPPFRLLAVAGELDQFVPPESSLGPFPESFQRVIPGNHLSMLRAESADAPCVQILVQALSNGVGGGGTRSAARIAAERRDFREVIDRLWPHRTDLDDAGAGSLALALDVEGRRQDAIELLEGHAARGTDVLGILAGRYKRRWLVEHRRADVEKAVELYRRGYSVAANREPPDHSQAFYHGINLAFLELAYGEDYYAACELAETVLTNCAAANRHDHELWRLATEGDALMILGRNELAIEKHSEASRHEMSPWQALSIQEQAIRIADVCGLSKGEIERLSDLYEKVIFEAAPHD